MRKIRLVGLVAWWTTTTIGAPTPAFHTVQAGETVYAIAKKYGTTTDLILKTNPGLDPSRLHAGDKLRLPATPAAQPVSAAKTSPATTEPATPRSPKEWVRVQKGDTLSKIARENKVAVENLRKWNKLGNDPIRPGHLLRILPPSSSPTASAPASKPGPSVAPAPPAKKPVALEWKFVDAARRQIDAPKDNLRDWEYIVVHHSGTSGGSAKVFDYYHSQERGMENGLAYHFVIGNGTDSGDGQIEVGRRWLKQLQGGHLASESLNEIAIGICLVGDFSRSRLGPRQTAALVELVKYLRQMMPDRRLKFRLHREINTRPTECPGRLFPAPAIHELLDQPPATG